MLTFDGSKLLVSIFQDQKYYQIEGITKTRISLTNHYIEQVNLLDSEWKEVLEASGRSSLTIEIEGMYSNSFAEKILIINAFAKKKKQLNISFGNEDIIKGNFFITNYYRTGNVNETETYSLILVSTAEIQYSFDQSIKIQ